jgi:radical SAM superfamily enzyme YgiQ (UPF0313 family)
MTSRRLLLINPARVIEGSPRYGASQFSVPPLGLAYVASLTPAGWRIRIVDETLGQEAESTWTPDLVGITALTPNAPRAYHLAARYRALGIPVVLGGVHATAAPEEAARYADTVVLGDAEPVWPEVINDFESRRMRKTYRGRLPTLQALPRPRRELYPSGYFCETIITSKGCPNNCEFCSVWRFCGRRYLVRPIEEVVDELEHLPGKGIVYFADDNLTTDRRRAVELCKLIYKRGIRRPYVVCGTLGMAEDDELLSWLRRSGCMFVFVGLESLRPEAVRQLGKPDLVRIGVTGYRKRIARIHAHGLAVYGSFIVGLDGDTAGVFDEIRMFSRETNIDCTLVNVLNPTPGTLLWERLRRQGRLLYTSFPGDYALYAQDNVCFVPSGMTALELQQGASRLIAELTRLPDALRRAVATWRSTRKPLAALVAFAWNWRTHRSLRSFPARDVGELRAAARASRGAGPVRVRSAQDLGGCP